MLLYLKLKYYVHHVCTRPWFCNEQFFFFWLYSGLPGPVDAEGFRNALYMIDIGQNDVNALLSYLSYDQVVARFPPILDEIKDAIQVFIFFPLLWTKIMYHILCQINRTFYLLSKCRLCMTMGAGTSGFMEQGLLAAFLRSSPFLGRMTAILIQMVALRPTTELQSHSTQRWAASAISWARRWKMRLSFTPICSLSSTTSLRTAQNTVSKRSIPNHNSRSNHLGIRSVSYNCCSSGFDKPLMTCCGYGGPPYNYNITIGCQDKNASVCDDGSKFVSWDGVHLTEAANAIVAKGILSSDYSRPKIKFDQFCKVWW